MANICLKMAKGKNRENSHKIRIVSSDSTMGEKFSKSKRNFRINIK